jgi:hypothetical protein
MLGRIKDPADHRDYLWRTAVVPAPIVLPAKHKVTALGPVLDQGNTPTCVPHTAASIKMHEEYREHRRYLDFDRQRLYKACKLIDGFAGQDGTTMRACCTVIADPKQAIYAAARLQLDGRSVPVTPDTYTIASYVRCSSLQEIKEACYADGPVGLGMDIDSAWQTPAPDGQIHAPTGHLLGGHEICVGGWDDERSSLYIKNSWGTTYGYFGYVWLPYAHLDKYNDWDAWRMTDTVIGPDA